MIIYSSVEITDLTNANPMIFTVTPTKYDHLTKTVNVNAYTFPVAIDDEFLPNTFELYEPFPNPFNPTTAIRFSVAATYASQLQVFDITGRLVETLIDKDLNPGEYTIQWNASSFPSGVYFVRLNSSMKTQTRKVLLLK